MKNDKPKTIFLNDYKKPAYLVESVDLHFFLFDDHVLVRSTLSLLADCEDPGDLVLDGKDLELLSLALDGNKLSSDQYRIEDHSLTIIRPPAAFSLTIKTRIKPRDNTSLEGLYISNDIFCTQCEAEGFRKITYFVDRPDIMAVYTTTIEADKDRYPVLLANGNLVQQGELADGRHFCTWHDPYKKPSYLFAMVAGDLVRVADSFTTCSGRKTKLEIYVEPHNSEKCAHALHSLQQAMAWDEKVFGLEYDLDQYMIVAVDDFNFGAMENKGLNVFNSKYILAKPETATDSDYEGIEAVVGHEYFHNWTGNRITCRDWFQLSLKEGLTVFRDREFSADMGSRPVKRIENVKLLRNSQFPEDAGPMAHPVRPSSYIEINNFYTLTVYEKGAELICMFHTLLGPKFFRQAIDLYIARHDGQAVTIDDFAKAMADVFNNDCHGRDPIDFDQFKLWYAQAGTPELRVSSEYDQQSKTYNLIVKQQKPANATSDHKMMLIPLTVGLLDKNGNDLPLQLIAEEGSEQQSRSRTLQVSKEEQVFTFARIAEQPVPSLLRGFSAPVKLHYQYTDDELKFLLLHDSDPFNQWEAGQRYFIKRLLEMVRLQQQGLEMTLDPSLINIFTAMLAPDFDEDKSFISHLLTLPSEEYLSELVDVVDVDSIHAAREFMRKGLAASLRDYLLQTYEHCIDHEPYTYTPARAGQRRLKNLCLSYLSTLDDPQCKELVLNQLERADNMSDEISGLQAVAHNAWPERGKALRDFRAKWQHEPLVIDKWFVLQATAPLADTLIKVRELMTDKLFSLRNPNKVRSLIGAYCANQVCFHHQDGQGYRFLTDRVLELNKLNSSVAARLLGKLSRWRIYDRNRQQLMRAELERVIKSKSLAKGVYEVASKSLEA